MARRSKEPEASANDPHSPIEENGKPNYAYWVTMLKAAEEAARPSWDEVSLAWDEYLNRTNRARSIKDALHREVRARFPIFWSSIKTIQPGIYSKTPVVATERSFDNAEDNVARVACILAERASKYLMRCCPFDRVQYATRDDYIIGGKTTNRVIFDSEMEESTTRIDYTPQPIPSMDPNVPPTMQYMNAQGQPFQGQELLQDDNGFYEEQIQEKLGSWSCSLIPVNYKDILHTPNARHWEEVDWISFESLMTKDDAKDRFGDNIAEKLNYTALGRAEKDDSKRDQKKGLPTLYARIYEIWNKPKKEVYWLNFDYKDDFLDTKPDPYELVGFFPCPAFMLGTTGPDDMYPVPDFIQLEPIIKQLHGMASRLAVLIRAAQRRGIFDSSVPELEELANSLSEAEFLGVKNFKQLIGDGGLEKLVVFFPTEKFVSAAQELAQAIELYEQKFNDIWGIPDILRGVSDPNETAAAQQMKGKYLSLRFSAIQREFQRLVRDDIELMLDLALKKLPTQELMDIMGVQYLEQEDQQVVPQALELLKNDTQRHVRIDIETDSTITMNQNEEIEQRNYLAKTVFDGLAAVATASSQNPIYADAAMQMLIYVTQGLRKGKEIEESLRGIKKQMEQQSQQPPPPDPEMIKAQAKIQQEQIRGQTDIAVSQAAAQADISRENVKAQNKIQIEQMMAQHDAQLKSLEAQLMEFKAMLSAKLEMQKSTNDAELHKQTAQQENKLTMIEAARAFADKPPDGEVHIHLGGK